MEKTAELWTQHYQSQFAAPDLNKLLPAPDIDNTDTTEQKTLDIDQMDIENAFTKCKMNTSPGPSKIGYFHLKSAYDANPTFFTTMIENILNNEDFDPMFCKMDIIPI